MTEKLKRRLTMVLCADVQGYSHLMEADEAGTLATLRRYRAAMAALIERHDGRIVNTWGDAVIAEFPSVVEAVQCAIETQQELSTQDPHLPEVQRLRFRIGVNLGDVMVDGSDIYGHGVNIAARIQELAEPGGILVSGPVYDQVHNKLSVGFDYIRQQMKNVSAPVTSYRVALSGTTLGPLESRRGVEPSLSAARPIYARPPHDKAGAKTHVPSLPCERASSSLCSCFWSICSVACTRSGFIGRPCPFCLLSFYGWGCAVARCPKERSRLRQAVSEATFRSKFHQEPSTLRPHADATCT
ncbi:adenylate/guanylate cyclase domain-containing protein [Microvirga sp.]|uniref:adenylate/guanylate cyclase domain-containing protein n=1 Tax=Microvirga sp. TaxID=1873136 RepID=UPI001FED2FB9|nr:adenylate/guanylate cyclase domain-containing protein [Microvirga sp.]